MYLGVGFQRKPEVQLIWTFNKKSNIGCTNKWINYLNINTELNKEYSIKQKYVPR